MDSFDRKKKSGKNIYKRFFPFIINLSFYILLFFVIRFYRQLVLFRYWKVVSIIVLVGFILFPFLFFDRLRKKQFGKISDPKLYDHIFYRKWISTFIAQVVSGFFGIGVSFYGLVICVKRGFLIDIWWPIVLFCIIFSIVIGNFLFINFLMLRKMEIGINNYGFFMVSFFVSWKDIEEIILDKRNNQIIVSWINTENVAYYEKTMVNIPVDIKIKSSSISSSLEDLFSILQKYHKFFSKG